MRPAYGELQRVTENFQLSLPGSRAWIANASGGYALVAELVDAYDSGSYGVTCGGSNPLESTTCSASLPKAGRAARKGRLDFRMQ